MLEALDTKALGTRGGAQDSVQELRDLIERMQGELALEKTRNEALNFEIARLKRWRFGSSSESLVTSTQQAVLFDAIVSDTALEDRAGEDALGSPRCRASNAKRCARRCPRACRASTSITRSNRRIAPAAKPSSASAKR